MLTNNPDSKPKAQIDPVQYVGEVHVIPQGHWTDGLEKDPARLRHVAQMQTAIVNLVDFSGNHPMFVEGLGYPVKRDNINLTTPTRLFPKGAPLSVDGLNAEQLRYAAEFGAPSLCLYQKLVSQLLPWGTPDELKGEEIARRAIQRKFDLFEAIQKYAEVRFIALDMRQKHLEEAIDRHFRHEQSASKVWVVAGQAHLPFMEEFEIANRKYAVSTEGGDIPPWMLEIKQKVIEDRKVPWEIRAERSFDFLQGLAST